MKLIVGIFVAALLLASCNKAPAPPVVFGASMWPAYEPVYLAQEQGYFAGANLRLAEYGSVAEVIQAFRAHAVQVAAMPLSEALLLHRDIPDLKIVLILDEAPSLPDRAGMPGKRLDVLVVRDDEIGKYHGELMGLVSGWQRALEFIRAQPEQSTQSMAKREKLAPEQFDKAMQGIELLGVQRNRELLLGDAPAVGAAVDAVQRYLLGRGLINMGADANTLLDTTLLPKDKS